MNRLFQLLAAVALVVGCDVCQAAEIDAAFDGPVRPDEVRRRQDAGRADVSTASVVPDNPLERQSIGTRPVRTWTVEFNDVEPG